jgi:hypothetical protein
MRRRLLLPVLLVGVVMNHAASAQVIPCASANFSGDTPGSPPALGGANQPSYLVQSPGSSILVQDAADGIGTRPVVMSPHDTGFLSVAFDIPPVTAGIMRIEATLAVSDFVTGFFLQTATTGGEFAAVASRIWLTQSGKVTSYDGTQIGTYTSNVPFRVRMDIDMSSKVWACIVDNELNGFGDDTWVTGLPFENQPFLVPNIGAVHASMEVLGPFPLNGSASYDDITVLCPDQLTVTRRPTWGEVKQRYR